MRPPPRRRVPRPRRRSRPAGRRRIGLAGKMVEKANEATAKQDAQAEALAGGAGETATTPSVTSVTPATPADAAPGVKPGKLTKKAAAAGGLPLRVLRALGDHKVVVLLFWSPSGAEDKSVRKLLDRHRSPRRQGAGARRAHQEDRRLRADHPRGATWSSRRRSSSSIVTARSRRWSAMSTASRSTRPSRTPCATPSGAYTRRVDAEAFAEHLQFPRGRGHVPPASCSGSAGGAACGDLIRVDLRVEAEAWSTPASRRPAAAR